MIKKICCINGKDEKILLIVEPWAEEYWIEPKGRVDVVGAGGVEDGFFEVEHLDMGMIVYGWEGSNLSVFVMVTW